MSYIVGYPEPPDGPDISRYPIRKRGSRAKWYRKHQGHDAFRWGFYAGAISMVGLQCAALLIIATCHRLWGWF